MANRRVAAHGSPSRTASRPRWPPGRKTFTGCWTCRARKLKCDETYPECNQCTRKNLACEGYSTRLQWLPCETGPAEGAAAMPVRTTTSQRRQITFSIPNSVFTDPELDRLLVNIEDDVLNKSQTRRQGPFGVFAAKDEKDAACGCSDHQSPSSDRSLPHTSSPSLGLSFDSSIHHQQPHQGQYGGVMNTGSTVAIDAVSHVRPFGAGEGGREPASWGDVQGMWPDFSSAAVPNPEPTSAVSFLDMLAAPAHLEEAVVPAVSTSIMPGSGLTSTSNRATAMDWGSPRGLLAGFSPTAVSIPSPSTLTANLLELLEAQEALNNANASASSSGEQPTNGHPDEASTSDNILRKELTGNDDTSGIESVPAAVPAPVLTPQPCGFFGKPETRFLLNYYVHNVIESFCIVANNNKSPWKSIHLPRALQGTGELEVMGQTSHARNALLNSLLSVSAYCLSNRYGCSTPEQEKWRKVGYQRRFQAVRSLQMGLAENMTSTDNSRDGGSRAAHNRGGHNGHGRALGSATRPKYKELLAAMLTMVSIDVASGETATTQMHLLGCESLIRSTKGWKRRYSSKARALHRIFYYLRVIYATTNPIDVLEEEEEEEGSADAIAAATAAPTSTAITVTNNVAATSDTTANVHMTSHDAKKRRGGRQPSPPSPSTRSNSSSHGSHNTHNKRDSPPGGGSSTRVWLEENLNDNSETATSCEFIYGVPASLLMLLSRVTVLISKLDRIRRRNNSNHQPNQRHHSATTATTTTITSTLDLDLGGGLGAEADQLEAEILDFPVDVDRTPAYAAFLSVQTPVDRTIIQHQIKAFHRAVLIYFSQNVRSMHATFLRPYVEDVIAHAEAIEALKQEHRVASGTLFWPCFIAAGEALDEALQQRFVRWYGLTNGCGFAGCLRGREVVYEVWRRRRSGCSRQRSSWRRVTEAQKVCLMLT